MSLLKATPGEESKLLLESATYHKLQSSNHTRRVTLSLLAVLVIGVWCLFAPWRQTVIGNGKVTVFSPMQRPQLIESQMTGRLKHWLIYEGEMVKKGQLLLELNDTDPKYMDPEQLYNLQAQRTALLQRQKAVNARLDALNIQGNALSRARQAALPGAGQKVQQSKAKLISAEQSVLAARQNETVSRANLDRLYALYQQGLRSKRDYELARLDQVKAETGVQQALAQVDVAQRDIQVSTLDRGKLTGDTAASLATVSSSVASAQESLGSVNSDLAKLSVDIANFKQRVQQRQIRAPINGRVVRVLPLGTGETILEGDSVATIVPDTRDQAIELYVSDWDVPLVSEGRLVRLQFAGWPAIQFSGWPSISTGTFAGRVKLVDAVDDGKGKYRILVVPDADAIAHGIDHPWPQASQLRPGTGATGWILLDTVSLGYELWRQFNAFPLSLQKKPDEDSTKADSKVKAPKRKAK